LFGGGVSIMLNTRICDFSDLQTALYNYVIPVIRLDDPVQYCVEACEYKNGEPPKYYAYILTKSKLIWASDVPIGKVSRYVEIEKITVRMTYKGDMYYVNVEYNTLARMAGDTDMFHFESQDKADAFANIIKRIGNLMSE
jgi:hypothetical protein